MLLLAFRAFPLLISRRTSLSAFVLPKDKMIVLLKKSEKLFADDDHVFK
jgi:hypothetical protein